MKLLKNWLNLIKQGIISLFSIKTKKNSLNNIDKTIKGETVFEINSNKNSETSINNFSSKVKFSENYLPDFNQIYYPEVIIPSVETEIISPQRVRKGLKGKTEKFFSHRITRYFKDFQVLDDCSLDIYEPDFAIINQQKGIYIDIEIDEPYSGITRNPIHFIDADLERNINFIERGWIVIRFSEKQIVEQSDSCCKIIAEKISEINNEYKVPRILLDIPDLIQQQKWTYEEAKEMANNNIRESYLGEWFKFIKQNADQVLFKPQAEIKSQYIKLFSNRIKNANSKKEYFGPKVLTSINETKINTVPSYTKNNATNSSKIIKKPICKNSNQKSDIILQEKRNELLKQASLINNGQARTDRRGNISAQSGIKNIPHRSHCNEKEYKQILNRYLSEKPNIFKVALNQKNEIEKEYRFLTCKIKHNKLICNGSIQQNFCDKYDVKIRYAYNKYPQVFIEARNHKIKPSPAIHMFSDNTLCLFYQPDHKWTSKTKLSETIIPWVSEWIILYELYQITNNWMGAESPYHIRENEVQHLDIN